MSDFPNVPAAFINAISEEGTKDEAVAWLQKQWNETCALREVLGEVLVEARIAGKVSPETFKRAHAVFNHGR